MMQTIGLTQPREAVSGARWHELEERQVVFRKRIKTRLQISLERIRIDMSGLLGKTLLEALIGHGLSDRSLALSVSRLCSNGIFYCFDTEDLNEWVASIELKNDGKHLISARGANKNIDAIPWDKVEIHSRYDLFEKLLKDV